MRVAVGSDHAGFEGDSPYKPAIMKHLQDRGVDVLDCGTDGPDSVDYPDYAAAACRAVLDGKAERAVLLCGTGIGVGIAANRFKGIRAATCATKEMARLAREHNDANVICLGRRILSLDECFDLIDAWLDTPFSGVERHSRRIEKMDGLCCPGC